MEIRSLVLICLAAAAAPSAFARYDGEECWNPRANHFEAVRPGERQDDLDFRVCRPKYTGRGQPDWHAGERECWNPRAGHFQRDRPGERQDDLNFRLEKQHLWLSRRPPSKSRLLRKRPIPQPVKNTPSKATPPSVSIGWGVPQEVIEQLIGAPLPDPAMTVKVFASANGLEFETLKPALQAEVDKVKP